MRRGSVTAVQEFSPDALVHLAARTDLDEKTDLDRLRRQRRGRAEPDRRGSPHVQSDQTGDLDVVAAGMPRRLRPARRTRTTPPTRMYGRSKIRTEQIVRAAGRRRPRMVPGAPDDGLGPRRRVRTTSGSFE